MAPHDVGLSFDLDIDTADIDAGVRAADRFMRPRILEALETAAGAGVRRAKVEHRYKNRTGALTKSIHSEPARITKDGAAVDLVADAPHAAPIHNGSRAHIIRARRAKALAFMGNGGSMLFRKSVMHPGTMPDAFLDDAIFGQLDFATDVVAAYATEAFDEAGFG
jgi:hypothetical protein